MKAKFVKRFISLLISLILIVTSVPLFAASAYAAEEDRFLFAYFTGNGNVATPAAWMTRQSALQFPPTVIITKRLAAEIR